MIRRVPALRQRLFVRRNAGTQLQLTGTRKQPHRPCLNVYNGHALCQIFIVDSLNGHRNQTWFLVSGDLIHYALRRRTIG